uniref:Reverse transcriptase domain-containing protein n=1 Tax=Tanacetum cinerariifolium TaxID=118510 RepID=A0A6L2MCT9_TANCI|nr:reverse transcriptase domain-containing protein [Tanacetum cinerariifolium]
MDTQEKDKNKTKNDKTKHEMEKIKKDKVIRRNYNPKGEGFLIASRFPTPPLASIVEPLRIELPFLEDQFQEDPPKDPPEVLMADNRTLAELLQAPTKGYEDAIDSLNSAAGGNFLDKVPRECLKIIENKSKVRQTRAKAVVAKVSTSSSTPAISSDVVELKDMLKQLSQTVLLAVVLTRTKIVPLQAEAFIETKSKSMCHKPPQQITTKETPVSDLRWMQIKFDLPVFIPIKIIKTISIGGTISIKTEVVISTNLISTKVATSIKANLFDPRRRDQANEQIEKFYEIFKEMSFKISFTDALILRPKFASTLKALIGNKEKLSEMAPTPMNEHCLAFILNKLPRKLGDPRKFLIPCEFPGMDECLAVADLGASINLMPLFVWEGLSLSKLTPTCMTLELADRSVSKPIGVAKDVSVKVGVFHFLADFVVVDFEPDPRVPLILGRYSANYNQMTANKIDVICEMYSQEVLGFSDTTASGNPTPYDDPIISTTSPTLTLFGDSDFLLFEEADAFLAILNSEPLPPLPNHEQYMPSYKKELKVCEAKTVKSSIDEPPEAKLKDLHPHLEYAFLEGNNKLPVIISKELRDEEKSALIKVLKSHKRAIAWKLSDIQGINPEFCTHKILMEEDYKPAVQHQRRVNPKIYDIIKKEVEKLLDAGLIYPISDSPWVSLVHCVPKKGGFTVIENEENELIPTCLVTGWREKTTFTYPYETFAYRRMPFGLCNAPGTFQRCMLAIFHDMFEKMMEVFVDDFWVFGNSFENCLSRLDKMLQMCEDTNLSLNWEKSHFMVKEDFSKISRPMTHLLEKNTPFIFSEDCIKAFQMLKKNLTEALILIAPNWDLPFEIMYDASDFAIGEVLGQRHEKHFKPIHYDSKTMNDAKSNYTTTEKEMLAVVYAFKKFRSYLIMNKSIVHTDHSALKYLFAKKDAKAR